MGKGRLEAFSDGVIAIVITIMVLEMKVPHGAEPDALRPVLPAFLSYILSFIYVGIYWNNHHHIFHAVQRVSGMALWANLHLLFWLSLIPFVTRWMGETHFGTLTHPPPQQEVAPGDADGVEPQSPRAPYRQPREEAQAEAGEPVPDAHLAEEPVESRGEDQKS